MICRNYPSLKTIVPEVSQIVLPRREIIKAIDSAALDELVYLTAPYGCGKTLAAISWLREHKKSAAWVSLGKGDYLPEALWPLLTASILRLAGEHDKAESILKDTCSTQKDSSLFSEVLIQFSPIIKNLTFIIDNCSVLQNSEVLQDLKNIICNMLGCWKIIFIGRGELPPIFNDLILKKCLRQITLNELSFTLDETAEYFHINGYSVDSKDLIRIQDETDGWPAAFNAILTAPQNGTVRYSFAARSRVMGYFETEIWEPLDKTTKEFLLKTSILEQLTPSICHSVTDIVETYPLLNHLYTNGYFMSKLEDFNSFCYHRVFKDFLLHKLNESEIDINKLYVKVGWWLYERNESISALLYFYKAGDICGINQAFKKVFPAKIGTDKYVEVASCLTSMDVNDLQEYPEVAARIALLHFIMGNIEEMKRIHEILRDWYKPGALSISRETYIDFTWEIGWLRYVNPDEDILFDKAFEEWVNVKDYAPHLHDSDRSRSSALRLPSAIRSVRDFSVDIARTKEYYKSNIRTDSCFVRDKADLFLSDLIIAEIAYEQEDFSEAERIVNEILPEIVRGKFTDLYFMSTVLLVKLLRATHIYKEIDSLTNRLGAMIENNGHNFLLPNFHAFELRNRLENGHPGMTEIFKNENERYADKPYYYLIYRHITLVRALLSDSRYSESIVILGNLALLCHQYKRNMDMIEVNSLRSVAEHGMGHESKAREYIMEALDAGKKCGFLRIFADDAAIIWPILNLLRKQDHDEYIEHVILSCKKSISHAGVTDRSKQEARKTLTVAETAIINLLRSGLTYPEIARDRGVKIHTVKSQMCSIYSKLDAHDKVSAVLKAEKLGLFGNS